MNVINYARRLGKHALLVITLYWKLWTVMPACVLYSRAIMLKVAPDISRGAAQFTQWQSVLDILFLNMEDRDSYIFIHFYLALKPFLASTARIYYVSTYFWLF